MYVVYAPHNHREQTARDEFWEDLADKIHSHKRSQPFLIVGDFNAQLLDELSSVEGAVRPQFMWEKTLESQENEGEGDSSHVKFFELIFQEDLCLPQTWMEKDFRQRIARAQPAGEQVRTPSEQRDSQHPSPAHRCRTLHTATPHSILTLDGTHCNKQSTQPHSNAYHAWQNNQSKSGSRRTPEDRATAREKGDRDEEARLHKGGSRTSQT